MHLPKELSWTVMRYTDPDMPLAQSDEDRLLKMPPPQAVEDGKFLALQIHLQLGTVNVHRLLVAWRAQAHRAGTACYFLSSTHLAPTVLRRPLHASA